MRDDFLATVKDLLSRRVGLRCSNPKCRRLTTEPDSSGEKTVNLGVAAHITAASPGGPRFDSNLNPEQRCGVENGIWLCQTCAKLVDSDLKKFTREVLRDWKETAEHLARSELHGLNLPASESQNETPISFNSSDWMIWRNRGNLPGDQFVILDGWERGDIRYSVRIRLRNNCPFEEVLHHFEIEFQSDSDVIHTESVQFPGGEVHLPAGKWVSLDVDDGLRDRSIFERIKSVWFKAEGVSDNRIYRWPIAEIDALSVDFWSES